MLTARKQQKRLLDLFIVCLMTFQHMIRITVSTSKFTMGESKECTYTNDLSLNVRKYYKQMTLGSFPFYCILQFYQKAFIM